MRIFKGVAHNFEVAVIDETGAFVPVLTIAFDIRRCSDNVSIESGNLSEVPPVYAHTTGIPTAGEYRVIYTAPAGYESGFETIIVDDYDNYKADVSTLPDIKDKTDLIIGTPATAGEAMSLTVAEREAIVAKLLTMDDTVETGVNIRSTFRTLLASLAGTAAGGGTNHILFSNPAGTAARLTMTVDVDGNRSTVGILG